MKRGELAPWALLLAAAGCDTPPQDAGAGGPAPGPEVLEAWETVYSVLQHPRCANCHPRDRRPTQGDDRVPHAQFVEGGASGRGVPGLACAGCHRDSNLGPAPLAPGAPGWRMPSERLGLVFQGRSSGELCRQLRDPRRNGGRTPEALLEHGATDGFVLWGWNPGGGRTPVPVPHDEFLRALGTWIEGGCGCP